MMGRLLPMAVTSLVHGSTGKLLENNVQSAPIATFRQCNLGFVPWRSQKRSGLAVCNENQNKMKASCVALRVQFKYNTPNAR